MPDLMKELYNTILAAANSQLSESRAISSLVGTFTTMVPTLDWERPFHRIDNVSAEIHNWLQLLISEDRPDDTVNCLLFVLVQPGTPTGGLGCDLEVFAYREQRPRAKGWIKHWPSHQSASSKAMQVWFDGLEAQAEASGRNGDYVTTFPPMALAAIILSRFWRKLGAECWIHHAAVYLTWTGGEEMMLHPVD